VTAVNVITFRWILDFLLLATLEMMDKCLSDYNRRDRYSEAGSTKDKQANSSTGTAFREPEGKG
jgi:hypothetical protein